MVPIRLLSGFPRAKMTIFSCDGFRDDDKFVGAQVKGYDVLSNHDLDDTDVFGNAHVLG